MNYIIIMRLMSINFVAAVAKTMHNDLFTLKLFFGFGDTDVSVSVSV